MSDNISKPWSVQIELVEGCNRFCDFCGINGIRKGVGDYKRMNIEVATMVAKDCAEAFPLARYEFAMHGEPTMHQHLELFITRFRKWLPKAQFQMTTNGKVWLKSADVMRERVQELFKAGIDFIVLDTYLPERDRLRELAHETGFSLYDFYTDEDCPSPWHNHRRKLQNTIILMDDLNLVDGKVSSRIIVNHAGNSGSVLALSSPLVKTCTLPFREISIRWDGKVSLCCNDWGNEYQVGDVLDDHLLSIWEEEPFQIARKFLRNKMRLFNPCVRCNMGSGSRSGLLPKYPEPTHMDCKRLLDILEHSPRINGFPIKVLKEEFDGFQGI